MLRDYSGEVDRSKVTDGAHELQKIDLIVTISLDHRTK